MKYGKFAALALALALMTGLPAAFAAPVQGQVTIEDRTVEAENREGAHIGQVVVNPGQSSHIRAGDGTEYKSIAIGRNGERLDCVGLMLSGWYRVLLDNGNLGYISYKYTKLDTTAHREPAVESPIEIMAVRASSERPRSKYPDGADNYYYFYAQNMLDGDLTTAWTPGEGVPYWGDGSGEYADFYFRNPVRLEGIQLLNGYQRSKESFYQNNRADEITVSFQRSGQADFTDPVTFRLYDHQVGWQNLQFDPVENVTAFRITVDSVLPGSKYDYDVGITEVRASGQE